MKYHCAYAFRLFVICAAFCLLAGGTYLQAAGAENAATDAEVLSGIKRAANDAANALIPRQNADGGYGPQMNGSSDVGVTALVVWALAGSPARYREWHGPYISAAVDFLLAQQKPSGGIHDGSLWNYKTSMSIMALSAVNKEKYAERINRAVAFVKGLQLNEESRLPYKEKRHVDYGGWGYGSTKRADLSNTQFALEVLHEADISPDDPVYKRAKVFLSRCQNSCDTNDAVVDGMIPGLGTNDDGGFVYRPGEGKVPPTKLQDGSLHYTSYGSMTYAGVKSLIYAHIDRNDERVKKAYSWLCKHFTLDENPGMAVEGKPGSGRQGLYYYYRTMAKTLLEWGKGTVPASGGERYWARDLAQKLISLQRDDGTWTNEVDRWWEGIPEIATPYAILTLQDCAEALKRWPARQAEEKQE